MNLLDKLWLALLLAAALTIFSCENPSDVGLELDPDGLRVDVHYKELAIPSTNLFIDSLRTDEYAYLLVGQTADPIFGTTQIEALTQIGLSSSFSIRDTMIYVFDSAFLHLELGYVHSAENLGDQTIRVHQLQDTIYASPFYLSNFQTDYDELTIDGEAIFNSAQLMLTDEDEDGINDPDTLTVELGDRMGNILLDLLLSEGSSFQNLREDFKGLALVGDASNNAILGFNASGGTKLELHYHLLDTFRNDQNVLMDSVFQDSLIVDFALNFNGGARYNKYVTDRNSSTIGNAMGANFEGFDVQDGNVYLQPASGIYPVLDFDPLNEFFVEFPRVQINRLEISMDADSDETNLENVNNIRFFYIDEKFDLVDQDTVYNNTYNNINTSALFANSLVGFGIMTDASYLSGSPQQLIVPKDGSAYNGVATLFGQFLDRGLLSARKIILIPGDLSLPNRSIIDQESIKLKLYYTLPKEN